MKTSIKILFLLSCVLVLSACANPFKKAEQEPKERVYSCADLKNETSRADCMTQTNDIVLNALNSEITSTFDTKRCVEMPQEMADECVKQIQESGVQGPISDEQVQALRDSMNPSFKVPEGAEGQDVESEQYYDITKCATLTEAGLKEYCEKQLNKRINEDTALKIVGSRDATKCDELKDEISKRNCKIELGTLTEKPEVLRGEEPVVEITEPVGTAEPGMGGEAVKPAVPTGAPEPQADGGVVEPDKTVNPVSEDMPE